MNWKMVWMIAVVFALSLVLGGAGADLISGAEARTLVKSGAAIVDVRTPEEFADGHIEGARNIPLSDLTARVAEVGAKTKPVVVYCFSGARSRRAAQLLRDAGYTQVKDLGAMSRWGKQ